MADKKGKKEIPRLSENQFQYMPPQIMDKILSNMDQASRKNFRQADRRSWHAVDHKDYLDLRDARIILGDAAVPYTNPQLLSRLYHLNSGKSANATGIVIKHYNIKGGYSYQTGAPVEKWSKNNCSITTIYYKDIPTQVDEEIWQVGAPEDKYYRVDGPALIRFYKNGQTRSETWYVTPGKVSRPDSYGQTIWNENGKIISQHWYPGRKDTKRLKALQSILLNYLVEAIGYDGNEYVHDVMYNIGIDEADDDWIEMDRVEKAFSLAILKLDITDEIMEQLNTYPDPEGNEIDMGDLQEITADIPYDDEQLLKLTKEIYDEILKIEQYDK